MSYNTLVKNIQRADRRKARQQLQEDRTQRRAILQGIVSPESPDGTEIDRTLLDTGVALGTLVCATSLAVRMLRQTGVHKVFPVALLTAGVHAADTLMQDGLAATAAYAVEYIRPSTTTLE